MNPETSVVAAKEDRQAAEIAVFERMLEAARGCFSFSLAVCNSPALRDWIIAQIKLSFPKIHLIRVPPETIDVYGYVIGQPNGPEPCDGIFIVGLEDSVPNDETRARHTIRSLNASRDLWQRRFACPIVFWLPEYAVPLLARDGPDLWRYLSHHFEFVSERAGVAAGMQDRGTGDFPLLTGLPLDQKHFRIAELEQRIQEADAIIAKDPAGSGQLIRHSLRWIQELGHLFYALADYQQAEESFRKSLTIAEKLGDAEQAIAAFYSSLGSIYRARAEFEKAREHFERALKIDEQAFGPDHPSVAIIVNNLGSVLQELGDLLGARQAYERALKIDEKALGPDHPQVAIIVNNLGRVLHDLGDLPGAKQAFERALKIHEAAFGPEHPDVARDVNNLGGLLLGLRDLPGAREAGERALGIFRKFLGDEHPRTQVARKNLEYVKRLLGGEHQPPE